MRAEFEIKGHQFFPLDYCPEIGLMAPGLCTHRPSDRRIAPDVIVCTSKNFPSQFIIGPKLNCVAIQRGMEILDHLRPDKEHRQVNVIVANRYDPSRHDYILPKTGLPYSNDLLESLGLLEDIDEKEYGKPDPSRVMLGVIPDLRRLIFFTYDLISFMLAHYGKYFLTACAAIDAESIEHELAHLWQHRNGLGTYNYKSERHAISEGGKLLKWLLLHNWIPTDEEKDVVRRLYQLARISKQHKKSGVGYTGKPYLDPDLISPETGWENVVFEDFVFPD